MKLVIAAFIITQLLPNNMVRPKRVEAIIPKVTQNFSSMPLTNNIATSESITSEVVVVLTPLPKTIATVKYNPPAVTGNAYDWYKASGITADWADVNWLVSVESGWNPAAVNKYSGACGLGQQLSCGKWAHQWNDPVGGLIDMNGYVLSRYGSWSNAVAFHKLHNWY